MGYEEPPIEEILELAWPYLPTGGALGEMVLSVGKAAYLAKHGADGIIDISPFTCMNGIVSEAIYPKLSQGLRRHSHPQFLLRRHPVRPRPRPGNLYGTGPLLSREEDRIARRYPAYFGQPVVA